MSPALPIIIGGTYDVSGSTEVGLRVGTVSFTGTVVRVGALTVGTTADFSPTSGSPIVLTSLTLNAGGTLTGTADFVVEGQFDWDGGTLSGTGAVDIALGASMNLTGGTHYMDGLTLNNSGETTWSGGHIQEIQPSAIHNLAGATFDIRVNEDSYFRS